jgi:HK97 family phage major capsid protein
VRALVPKTLAVELVISRRLLQQSGMAIEQDLRKELLKRVLNELDAAILVGDGNLQPLGLLNDPDIEVLSAGANGAPPSWEHVCALEYAVGARHGQMDTPAFVMHPALRRKMRTTPRANGQDFLMSGDQLLQKPVNVSAVLPTNLTKGTATDLTPLIFGDLSQIVVGFWGPAAVDLMVDPMSRSTTGAIRLIAHVEVGSVVRYAGAVSVYKDLVTV